MAWWYVYMVQCNDSSLYSGVTTDVERRVMEHNTDTKGAKYTKARRPVRLVYQRRCRNRSSATKQEAALKQLTRAQKIALLKKC